MGLRLKFNLCLLGILLMGMLVSGIFGYRMLQSNARDEVMQHATLLMETALATRTYTTNQIKPHLDPRLDVEFLPQTVPAFAATETLNEVRKKFPEYSYKEAALNPTNPRDRASEWETDIINAYRQAPDKAEMIVGERMQGDARMLYIAKPIQIKNPACLACHTTPAMAPASMIKLYGESNGFGWQLNEIIGAQIVTVPMLLPVAKADKAFYTFMASLLGVFVVIFLSLHVMLTRFVLNPLERMADVASEISKGKLDVPELDETGKDEVSRLAVVFNRMARSLKKAMQMLDQ